MPVNKLNKLLNDKETRDRVLLRIWRMLPALTMVLLFLLILILLAGISVKKKRIEAEKIAAMKKNKPPVNVVILETTPQTIRDSLSLPAIVEAWVDLTVFAEVPGTVVEVPIREGARLQKGDVIARIDSRDFQNSLASAQAAYDRALADLKRTEQLRLKETTTKAKYDEAVSAERELKAALENAKLRFERSVIRAPINGMVNRLDAKEGLYLNVQDPAAQMLDISRVKVSVGIPESDVDAVRNVDSYDIEFEALNGKNLRGKKYFLSKSPDNMAHLYKLQISLDNPAGTILPGMFARVRIVKKEVQDSLSVPLYAVITRQDRQFVMVEENGKASERMVETGILEGWKLEITKGIQPGDRVIVVGHRSVSEGQEVNVVRTVTDPEDLFK